MRQATTPRNGLPARGAFGAPLNEVLGAEANVRLLRELALDHGRYVTPGELAKRTGLTRAAVYRALERLFAAGVIEYDSSVAQRCRLQHASPVVSALRDLFRAEAQRVVNVMEALRTAIGELSPPPISAWIEGRARTGEDEYGDPIVVGLLDVPDHLDVHVEILQERTVALQREQDVTIEVRGRTRADLASLPSPARDDLADAVHLFGSPVEVFVAPEKHRQAAPAESHRDLEERALAYAKAIAQRLRTEPELTDRACEWLEDRMEDAPETERRELREWTRILRSMTPARLSRFLVDPSERAARLRQTNPFVGALSERERREILPERNGS